METLAADIVIIGAGSAGCVLARRLSEDPRRQVLLLEAGTKRNAFLSDIPGMTVRLMGNPRFDWCYSAESDPTINGRQIGWNGGKMLGGSSSINGLVYIRGLRRDYDEWERQGCSGWSWQEVEPYFRKAERFDEGDLPSLGTDGPLWVSRIRSLHPLTSRFVDACAQSGLPVLQDYNEAQGEGAFVNLTSQRRGRRSSTANCYLEPVTGPANLRILRGALADRILIEGGRAAGVLAGGYSFKPTIFADVEPQSRLAREVIFDPVLSVIRFKTEEEALRIANDSDLGLAAYVQTSNLDPAHRLAAKLQAGYVNINGFAVWIPPRRSAGTSNAVSGASAAAPGSKNFYKPRTCSFILTSATGLVDAKNVATNVALRHPAVE